MSRRINKLTPDNYLKKLILNAVENGNHLSEEIIDYVLTTPYYYEEEDGDVMENWYGGGVGGVRTGITAMKNAGYLTLYPKDEYGNSIQVKPKRPYLYYLTATGVIHCENPHIKRDYRGQRISDEAYRLMQDLLVDEPSFQEAVKEYVKTNEVPKLNIVRQKAPIIRYPRVKQGKTEKIIIEKPDDHGTEMEIELDSKNEINEVQELKAQLKQQEASHTATIQEYEKYVRELESALSQADVEAIKKYERTLSREEKIQQRYDLAVEYWNNGYYLDENFFQQWDGDYIIVILKKLMELGQLVAPECVDVFSRNSDLFKRRRSRIKRIISGEDIIGCEFFIKDFTDSGIVVSSPYLEEDKTLRW